MQQKIKTGVDEILSAVSSAKEQPPKYGDFKKTSKIKKEEAELMMWMNHYGPFPDFWTDKKIDEFRRKNRLRHQRIQTGKEMDPESRKFFAGENPDYQSPERRLGNRRKE